MVFESSFAMNAVKVFLIFPILNGPNTMIKIYSREYKKKIVLTKLVLIVFGVFTSNLRGQTTLISATGDGGFENGTTFIANGWTAVNAATNTWQVGTAATAFAGSNGAYVSNNSGTSWAYTTTVSQTSHFYRDVTVPAGETNIQLSFFWKGSGETNWDRLIVYTAPTSVTPVAGSPVSQSTTLAGATLIYTQASNSQTTYTQANVTLNSSIAGTTVRLIFTWQNDGAGGTSPGAAIDNISLISFPTTAMSGVYTIDNASAESASNFRSFDNAVRNINARGISGSVTFNVIAGQTFNENPLAFTATGTSTNTITFQKSGIGNNPKIIPTGTGTNDFGICISGGDYITFDGIDVDGSAATTTTNALEFGYLIRNASATNGAQYNTIKNCSITLNKNYISAAANACILISASTTGGGVAATNATGANSYNKYYNLILSNAQNGIYAVGTSTTYPDISSEFGVAGSGCQTSRNSISNIGGVFAGSAYGIYTQFQNGVKIFNFDITNIRSNGNTNFTSGILLVNFAGTNEIYNNKVNDLSSTGTAATGRVVGIEVQNTSGTHTARVYNNFIYDVKSSFTGTATTNIYSYGIYCNNTTTASVSEIDNNNVYLSATGSPTYSSACFAIASTSAVHKVRGNILVNSFPNQTTANHVAWYSVSTSSIGAAGSISNYNDLYVTGNNGFVGRGVTTTYTSLANWQSRTDAPDANSINIDPIFTNSTDLHVSAAGLSGISGFSPQAWVTTDIDCDLLVSPYRIGADANAASPCIAPTAQPSNLVFTNISASGLSGSFNASSPSSDGYLVIRSTSSTLSSNPTNAVSYSVGNTIGGGTVIQSGSSTSFTENSLTANVAYYYFIFSYNSNACSGGPVYYTTNPLTGNVTTCLSSPSTPSFSNITDNSLTISWGTVSGATSYSLEVSADNFSTQIAGSPFTANTNSYNLTSLTNNNRYYARVTAQGSTCNSSVSASSNTILLCSTPTSLAQSATSNSQTLTSIDGSFTAASVAPSGYLVIRTNNNTAPSPVNTTIYSVGANAIGYIEYVGASAGTWTSTGLTLGTTYYYWVFSYNSGANCTGPQYSSSSTSFSQSTKSCPTFQSVISINGASAVSGNSYPTITAAITEINLCSGISQPTIFELTSGYINELSNNTLTLPSITGMSSTNTITIRPASGVNNLEITSSVAGATVEIDGGDYWIIDGRPGGAGTLSSSNLAITNTSASTTGMAIQITNDAVGNVVRYSNLKSSFGAITSGVVILSGGTTNVTGNDNTTFEFNNINGNGSAFNGIYCAGAANVNDNAVIQNNNIYDFFNAANATNGINISSNNTSFTISNNSIYQTVTRTYTTGATHCGILINNTSGNNFSVNGNQIGGGFSVTGGPTPLNKYTILGSVANRYKAVNLAVGTTTSSSIQSNTIAGFDFSSTSNSTVNGGPWSGIYVSAGKINIGNSSGNTIGSSTGNSSITLNLQTNSGGVSSGIYIEGIASDFNISKNFIGSITTTGSTTSIAHGFTGITTLATGSITISNNVIGSRTATNSIYASNPATTTSSYQFLNGILNTGNSSALNISNNIVVNLNNAYDPSSFISNQNATVCGISSTNGKATITGDTIRNLTANSNTTNTGLKASVVGISISSTAGATISENLVHTLNSSNTAGTTVSVTGIAYSGSTSGTNTIERNSIYNLDNVSAVSGRVHGIYIVAGNTNIQNNVIRLGYNTLGTSITTPISIYGIFEGGGTNNYYHNSVFIGGNNVTSNTTIPSTASFYCSSATGTRNILNNIFVNARSNTSASGGPKNYAIYLPSSVTGLTSNYNLFHATGTGAVFGAISGGDRADFSAWKSSSSTPDANSINADPIFKDPTSALLPDLHIDTNGVSVSPANQAGISVAAVTLDFDGQTRSSFTPIDIGADAFNDFITLPVTLISLNAQCIEPNKVSISWISTNENNISHYIVYKSTCGKAWKEITKHPSSGNTFTTTNYKTTDYIQTSERYYYKIACYDKDGGYDEFITNGINCSIELLQNKIIAYPNPCDNNLNIKLYSANMDGTGKIVIYRSDGKVASEKNIIIKNGYNHYRMENMNLPSGIYFIKIYNKQESTKKIIQFIK